MPQSFSGRRLAVLGAGGHGRVVADCARAMQQWAAIEFYDDRWPALAMSGPWSIAGAVEHFFRLKPSADDVFVGVGDADVRIALLDRLAAAGKSIATIVHPRAVVSIDTDIAAGAVIMPGAVINIGAKIGRGAIVNTGATVDHDCVIGAGVHIAPGAHLSGNVEVGDLSWVGVGSSVRHGVRIGERCMIGAGGAVVADIDTGAIVMGVPARARII